MQNSWTDRDLVCYADMCESKKPSLDGDPDLPTGFPLVSNPDEYKGGCNYKGGGDVAFANLLQTFVMENDFSTMRKTTIHYIK